jgi:hypothetical protein
MDSSKYVGKEILISKSPVGIYNALSDLRNLGSTLPEELKEKATFDKDSIKANVKGISLGLKFDQKIPYSLLSLVDDGESPFHFKFSFYFVAVGFESTLFHVELDAELNTMLKMMLGGKLQELVDKLSDQIESQISQM